MVYFLPEIEVVNILSFLYKDIASHEWVISHQEFRLLTLVMLEPNNVNHLNMV